MLRENRIAVPNEYNLYIEWGTATARLAYSQLSDKLKEYLDSRREKFHEALERLEDSELQEKREAFMERYDEFERRYLEVKNSIRHISRRQMKAYPNLISKAERLRKLKEKNKK